MDDLSKTAFVAIVEDIVAGFEDPVFQTSFAEAKSTKNISAMMALPSKIQERAFAAQGLDPVAGQTAFKAAGRLFATDPDVAALLMRMKAAL